VAAAPRLLLCSDLDRTLIPNGHEPESAEARPLLARLAARPEVVLCYVSGRHAGLIRRAIDEHGLPVPDYAIGDVGTTLYTVDGEAWRPIEDWTRAIAGDWRGRTRDELEAELRDVPGLRLQEADKQNTYKLSYYIDEPGRLAERLPEVRGRLDALGIRYDLIVSHDALTGLGLLDCLPERATKYHAIEFLEGRLGLDAGRTVFAGDSGNDLPVLTSGLPSILVANAAPDVREAALEALRRKGLGDRLYCARGGLFGMNGNYSAGVLEGLVHFFPEVRDWLEGDGE